jgi:hypothetical protein
VADRALEARRPEVHLLLACARTHATAGIRERIRGLARERVDWAALERLAEAHGVLPLLTQQLEAHAGPEVPDAVRSRLRERMLAHAARSLALTRELVTMLTALAEGGVPALPYKGPALAVAAYGSPVLRQPGDLDIVLPGDRLSAARAVLAERGFRDALAGLDPEARAAHYQHAMVRDAVGVHVELHWAFAPRYFRFPLDPRALGREPLVLGGRRIDVIVPADHLVVLCVHGARHLWSRLGWVMDVAELVRARPEADWSTALARATGLGARRMLLVGLALARDLLGAELPEVLAEAVSTDPTASELGRQLSGRLLAVDAGPPGLVTVARLHLAMRERWQDRAAYALLGPITPSERDAPGLARGPRVLRAVARPFRLLRDHSLWHRGRPR